MINVKKIKSRNTKIGILGAGKSGLAVSKLAERLGFNFFLSDSGLPRNEINFNEINFEIGGHSEKIFNSDLIIKSPGIPNDIDIIKKAVKRNIPIISEVEFASWFAVSPIIGLTGTNGKTTTVNLIYHIFSNAGLNPMLGGNVGIPFSENVYKEITGKKREGVHILELSSFQLEHIIHLSLEVACILNISMDHLDRYDSFEKYIDAKLNILNTVKKNGFIVYNNNDSILNDRISDKNNIIPFSYSNIKSSYLNLNNIPLKGEHNQSNIAAALAISKIYNINSEIFAKSIKEFNPLPHRLEYLLTFNNTEIYNDSKSTNIDAMSVAIDAFNQNIIMIVGGIDKGKTDFLKIFQKYSSRISYVSCYGKSGQTIFNQIKNHIKSKYIQDFENSVFDAVSQCKGDDILLFSPGCASYDQFENYIDRGNKFKEIIFGLS